MQNDCVARARAVASVLAPCPHCRQARHCESGCWSQGTRLRFRCSPRPSSEWLNELAGPFQLEARLELRRQGASTLAALVGYWDRLRESAKKWLLEWAAETSPDLVLDRIREVLTKRSDGLILAALEAAAKLKDFPADLEILMIPLLEHSDELIRRAAVMACRSAFELATVLRERAIRPG